MASSRSSGFTEAVLAAVSACLERYVLPEHSLVVGLSGGVDSVVLLHAVRQIRSSVSALHVHHGLSANADAWEAHCRQVCSAWNIPLSVRRVTVERDSPAGLECAAREVRHRTLTESTADWVVLAHHQSDQAETLLFNLLRGAGVRGAAAMCERRGRVLRPLLDVERTTITRYAGENDLHWVDDESNADQRHSRNFLRHKIVPDLKKRFPAAEPNFAAAARRFGEAQELLDDLACLDLAAHGTDFPVPVAALSVLSAARARNVLRYLLARRGVQAPGESRLNEAIKQFLTAAQDRHPAVTIGGHRLVRRRGWLDLRPLLED